MKRISIRIASGDTRLVRNPILVGALLAVGVASLLFAPPLVVRGAASSGGRVTSAAPQSPSTQNGVELTALRRLGQVAPPALYRPEAGTFLAQFHALVRGLFDAVSYMRAWGQSLSELNASAHLQDTSAVVPPTDAQVGQAPSPPPPPPPPWHADPHPTKPPPLSPIEAEALAGTLPSAVKSGQIAAVP